MKKNMVILSVICLALFAGCTKNLPDPGATAAVKMANEWWITFSLDGNDLIGTRVKISTYNTAANSDSLWIDDLQNTWQFKCKARANYQTLGFSTDSSQNEYYDIRVKISKGQIFPNGGKSKTGNVTDSIYMEAVFTDDPNNTYVLSGVARTMYAEDDY